MMEISRLQVKDRMGKVRREKQKIEEGKNADSSLFSFGFCRLPSTIYQYLQTPLHIAPLVIFRILFGAMMCFSMLRFMYHGWVCEMYVEPDFYFSYFGFEWVKPLGYWGMHGLYTSLAIAAGLIMLGLCYRVSSVWFFIAFTYSELLDKTNYLNHYYFVSIIAFLLILVPANRYASLDIVLWPKLKRSHVPRWQICIFRFQLGIVYIYAGIAKLVPDWLLKAQPLRVWLAPMVYKPLIGKFMAYSWMPYLFSWFGAIYDLTIPFWLMWKKSRWLAYIAVITFHLMTAALFPIGMFPYIMICSTLLFFPADTQRKWLENIEHLVSRKSRNKMLDQVEENLHFSPSFSLQPNIHLVLKSLLIVHFAIQILVPWRYLLYPGNLFWNEEGYRFSWRVMLMEKDGIADFDVYDPDKNQKWAVYNPDYLTPNQEKMMASQPDMILQYAHYLAEVYQRKGIRNPQVYAHVYVTLNGRRSRPFVDDSVDLAKEDRGWSHKRWILPYERVFAEK